MQAHELRVDVTAAAGLGEPVDMAATIFLPERLEHERPTPLIFAVPGGGYSRGYFDLRLDGHAGYSQAAHHCARGAIVIAIDHVGVGDSWTADIGRISFDMFAATYDACCRSLLADLRAGTLLPALPALSDPVAIGIGQSMGGCVTVVTQGRHDTFEAIAVLGFSAIHTVVPQPPGGPAEEALDPADPDYVAKAGARIRDRVYPFFWEDVPADIIAADMQGGYPVRRQTPPFGSRTIPPCGFQTLRPGFIAQEAAMVKVPLFIGMGARDVSQDFRAEPAAYGASDDIVLAIIDDMAHMHNFASSRARLWDRLACWYDMLVATRAGRRR